MQKEIDAGEFIEHAEFSGNMYGTRYAVQMLSPLNPGGAGAEMIVKEKNILTW